MSPSFHCCSSSHWHSQTQHCYCCALCSLYLDSLNYCKFNFKVHLYVYPHLLCVTDLCIHCGFSFCSYFLVFLLLVLCYFVIKIFIYHFYMFNFRGTVIFIPFIKLKIFTLLCSGIFFVCSLEELLNLE